MGPLVVALASLTAFVLAYRLYGRRLARHVFRLSETAECPSRQRRDGVDFVPTPWVVVFGHHFTSIAGTGPIVGPAIAVLWGWLPALVWVVLGAIFIGAVHDLASLVVSLRNRGQTVGDIAGDVIGPRVRLLFLLILLLALNIVLAIFGLVIANTFRLFPAAIFPCLAQIPLAVAIGLYLRGSGSSSAGPAGRGGLLLPLSLAALVLMYLSVFLGDVGPLHAFNQTLAAWPLWVWVVLLLGYCGVASVLPVWVLLQPRDYINALQLLSALGLLFAGLVVAALVGGTSPDGQQVPLSFSAPAVQLAPAGAPPMLPFLFITVACGAISGFHCLVSSGTTSKQLARETDATAVGFGGMLTEGFLAVLVILACTAGLGLGIAAASATPSPTSPAGTLVGEAAYAATYGSWAAIQGNAAIRAFVTGSGNLLASLGIPATASVALMGVLVASFAATTLDTATRLQRYVIEELARALAPPSSDTARASPDAARASPEPARSTPPARRALGRVAHALQNRYVATSAAVLLALLLALLPAPGQSFSLATAGSGGLILWPLFGATNQLLGGLAFLVILFWLLVTGRPVLFALLPAVFMLAVPMWALTVQAFIGTASSPSWLASGRYLLAGMAAAALLLEIWMLAEAAAAYRKYRALNPAGLSLRPESPPTPPWSPSGR
ncbi:MAG: carbon starvation protein A [Tepidisphaerales bacterium]